MNAKKQERKDRNNNLSKYRKVNKWKNWKEHTKERKNERKNENKRRRGKWRR
jgi:hypothetical protein